MNFASFLRITLPIIFAILAFATSAFADRTNLTRSIDKGLVQVAGTNNPTTDEERLLVAIPELLWSQDRFVSEGWLKPGQVAKPKATNLSKKDAFRFGVTGEIGFLFLDQRLSEFTFYINDGEAGTTSGNNDWAKLYEATRKVCTSHKKRSGDAKSGSVSWVILGENNHYEVKLTRRVFGTTVERGLEISIQPIKK